MPVLTQHVTDQTGTLNASQIAEIEAELVTLEQRKGSQVAVLIVSTTGSEALENYSLAVAEKNKLGRSKTDDGLLLLIAKDDRKARIEVGYGLEGAVPDALASRIIREYLTPKFRQGDFFGIFTFIPATLRRLGAAGVAGVLATMMFTFGFATLVAAVVAFLVSASGSGRYSSGNGGWGSFGGGGGGSSGGGWSGGGGSFGGGGASGGW